MITRDAMVTSICSRISCLDALTLSRGVGGAIRGGNEMEPSLPLRAAADADAWRRSGWAQNSTEGRDPMGAVCRTTDARRCSSHRKPRSDILGIV